MRAIMQKRHYEQIAEIIREELHRASTGRHEANEAKVYHTKVLMARGVARGLAARNTGFNMNRFLKACGIEE